MRTAGGVCGLFTFVFLQSIFSVSMQMSETAHALHCGNYQQKKIFIMLQNRRTFSLEIMLLEQILIKIHTYPTTIQIITESKKRRLLSFIYHSQTMVYLVSPHPKRNKGS